MSKPFEALRQRLLIGGVAPRHIRRYIAELEDHLADLLVDAPNDAVARARLGDVATLAQPMLERPEFRSWTARAPQATLILGPVAGMILGTAAVLGPSALAILFLKWSTGQEHPLAPDWLRVVLQAFSSFLVYVLPILIGWSVAKLAIERRLPAMWPLTGLLVLAFVSGAYNVDFVFPTTVGQPGELRIGFGWAPPFPDNVKFGLRGVLNFVLTAGPYLLWHARKPRDGLT